MKRQTIGVIFVILVFGSVYSYSHAKKLPRPTYDNSLNLSFFYNIVARPGSEVDYIKSRFDKGLYAKLYFSRFIGLKMDWDKNIAKADKSIKVFKESVDALVQKAKSYNVGIHIVMTYGLSRNIFFYRWAKEEDIRNAQWYNDNNLTSKEDSRNRGF